MLAQTRQEELIELADRHRITVAEQLDAVEEAHRLQEEVVTAVEARLDERLAHAHYLEDVDAELANQIRVEEAVIARRIAEQELRRKQRDLGNIGIPDDVAPFEETVVIFGIRVHVSIAGNLKRLLIAAANDGVNLGGGGWRDIARQVELRRAHCGAGEYAIWEAPSWQCRPPTARPRASMHERGLAIDFTYQGRAIGSRGSAAFKWLADHAREYGFFNLPSEPWHWSTNGR